MTLSIDSLYYQDKSFLVCQDLSHTYSVVYQQLLNQGIILKNGFQNHASSK